MQTGFLGRELLSRLLVDSRDDVCVLVRPRDSVDATARIKEILCEIFGESAGSFEGRVKVIEGDLLAENFALGRDQYNYLTANIETLFHVAADVSFSRPLEEARSVNVGGTQRVLEFIDAAAGAGNDQIKLHYVSTAYVAGDVSSTVLPTSLRLDVPFKNSYEQSKAEAEALIRDRRQYNLKANIYRPSVVVGDSVSGKTNAFNVIYLPARYIAKGVVKRLPGLPNVPVDIVPVDYVADSIAEISKSSRVGEDFHLCQGPHHDTTIGEIVESMFLHSKRVYRRANKSTQNQTSIPRIFSFSAKISCRSPKWLQKCRKNRLPSPRQSIKNISFSPLHDEKSSV